MRIAEAEALSNNNAAVQCRHKDRSLGMVLKEVDGDLATFLEMRKREKENNGFVHIHTSDGFDDATGASNPDCSVVLDTIFSETLLKMTPADNLLDAENQQSDHDWLLTPPRTPPLEMSVQTANSQMETSSALPPAQVSSKPGNPPNVPPSMNDKSAKPITSTSDTSAVLRNGKPSSTKQKSTASRSATPNGRSTLRAAASRPSRSSTPTSRGITASGKPVAPPVRGAAARSATPPARSSVPSTSKSTSRSVTPTLKSSISSSATAASVPVPGRSSSVSKTVPTVSKNMGSRVGIVPMVKSRPKPSSDVPAISSSDAPSNSKTTVPKRPTSASRGRSTASSSQFSSTNLATVRSRQKSCSPSKVRVKDGSLDIGRTLLSRSRGYSSNGSDDVNPVLMGTKMVERVVNMRKLAPPKHNNNDSHDTSSGKSSSQDNSGFGRSLSKKSLDMAIRHMDIRRSLSGNLKTIVTSISAASLSSNRTGSSKSSTTSASDSPLATSSSTSSESSVHNICSNGVEVNDISSERELLPTN